MESYRNEIIARKFLFWVLISGRMECTLQEEEDEYDKVAVGREGASGRIFMGQIIDFGPAILNPLNPLPTSLSEMRQAARDARANHRAALARLEEDDQEAAASSRALNENAEAPVDRGSDMGECTTGSGEALMLYDLPVRLGNDGDAMDIDGGDGMLTATYPVFLAYGSFWVF